jgi:hypothetical protein
VIFTIAFIYARRQGPVEDRDDSEATALLTEPK